MEDEEEKEDYDHALMTSMKNGHHNAILASTRTQGPVPYRQRTWSDSMGPERPLSNKSSFTVLFASKD